MVLPGCHITRTQNKNSTRGRNSWNEIVETPTYQNSRTKLVSFISYVLGAIGKLGAMTVLMKCGVQTLGSNPLFGILPSVQLIVRNLVVIGQWQRFVMN